MIPVVNVTFTAFDQSGAPVSGGRVTARLDRTETHNGFVVPEEVTATTDASGVAVLPLWPNALGVDGSLYRVRAWNPDTGRKFLDTTISVPNSDCALEQIVLQEPYPPIDAAAQALLAAQGAGA